MKSLIVAALILFGCFSFNAHAQTYKINKQKYDYKMYMPQPGDPNNPAVMGLASFFIPGLGQMLSGETGRGLAFFRRFNSSVRHYCCRSINVVR